MKPKKILSVILLAFVAASAGWLIIQQGQSSIGDQSAPSSTDNTTATDNATAQDSATAADPEKKPTVKPDRVIVYYFHTTYRCPACTRIENYTREAVETGFAEELKNGRVEFHAINVEKQGNKHYVKDYKLHTKSVVVSDIRDGKEARWKNLKKVWRLLRNKETFFKYIRDEVNSYLQGK